jgi:hypothetical protein
VLKEKDSHESPVSLLAMFQHAVQPSMDVEPAERPLHLPPLAAIAPLMDIFRRATTGNSDMILPIRGDGNNASLAQGTAVRLAIVAFVQPQAVGFALALADANAINGLQQLDKVIAVRFTQGEVQRMAIAINDQMPFQPFDSVFSGVSDFFVRPFLDLTTLASW